MPSIFIKKFNTFCESEVVDAFESVFLESITLPDKAIMNLLIN